MFVSWVNSTFIGQISIYSTFKKFKSMRKKVSQVTILYNSTKNTGQINIFPMRVRMSNAKDWLLYIFAFFNARIFANINYLHYLPWEIVAMAANQEQYFVCGNER